MSMIYRHLLRLMLAAVVGAVPLTLLPTPSVKAEAPAVNVFEILHKQGITKLKSGQPYNLTDHITVTFHARLDNGNSVDLEIVKHSGRLHDNPSENYTGYYAQFSQGEDGGTEIVFSRSIDIAEGGLSTTIRNAGSAGWNST